jgi:hypothetical protein
MRTLSRFRRARPLEMKRQGFHLEVLGPSLDDL